MHAATSELKSKSQKKRTRKK